MIVAPETFMSDRKPDPADTKHTGLCSYDTGNMHDPHCDLLPNYRIILLNRYRFSAKNNDISLETIKILLIK